MNKLIPLLLIPILILGLLLLSAFVYTVQETEQVIITQFGKPVGAPVATAGLHFKLPLVQQVNRLDRWIMEWDAEPQEMQTADKLFISVDTYARWRISDPLKFFQSLHDEESAQSRLDDILDSETRNEVAKHSLIELVRTDKARKPAPVQELTTATASVVVNWQAIRLGRDVIAHEIHRKAKSKLEGLGIELIDIRFKRINYNPTVQEKIFERMKSERIQIAEKFRSEGQGEAARIGGERERRLNEIKSTAYRSTQEIRGKADAEATNIYAKAYNQSPAAYEFFQFQKTMDTYLTTLDKSTTLILSTQGDFFKYLKNVDTAAGTALAPAPKTATAATTATQAR